MRIDVREPAEGSSGNPRQRSLRKVGRIEIDPDQRPNLVRLPTREGGTGGRSSTVGESGLSDVAPAEASGERGTHCYLNWEGALDDSGQLRKCVLCGCDRLYRSKLLPQVTPFVVVIAFAGAIIGLLGFATNPLVLPGLVVLLVIDVATLALARVRLICYRCGSIYSRTKIARYHHRWNRSDAERVRSASATTVAAQASP